MAHIMAHVMAQQTPRPTHIMAHIMAHQTPCHLLEQQV